MKHTRKEWPIEHNIWASARYRCHNPNAASYKHYGGRGITMCDAWRENFSDFFEYLGPRPSKKHSIDRIDNDRGYEPGNVRWATRKMQSKNRRKKSPCVKKFLSTPLDGDPEIVSKLRKLLRVKSKVQIASVCMLQTTLTIDTWASRQKVPVKYHARLEAMYEEACK
jgi:hypothetical protein